ncbi:glycosyltransferase family 2 protein [Nocardioides pacificus]
MSDAEIRPADVTLLLVSHDGARWLPTVLAGVRAQRRAPDRIVAVDTGSRDESATLLSAAFGPDAVVSAPSSTSFPAAVERALTHVSGVSHGAPGEEWIWILHDDSTPDPGALEALLAAAQDDPSADILGPKLREWPSLRRLLEVGVTISATGRRETGLERGEYDQGQHDDVREVLAVNTAGMLVRRAVLERLGGFDEQLPIFGNDIDFGWRAAAAGHRTVCVPQAVVFHAEAAHRGVRRTSLTGRHTHYAERRAALFTLLANSPRRALAFRTLRLAVGTLLRMVGFLLVRSPGEALDELAALVSIYRRPGQIRDARRARRDLHGADPERVQSLLAPRWLPYRHGLDFVSDLAAAATHQAADVAERRRAAKLEAEGPPPGASQHRRPARAASVDDEMLEEDSGLVARFLTNPVAVSVLLFVVLAVVGAREALGAVSGGALSPAPAGASDWWRLHLESWHPLALGTDVPAPAYLLPLALGASLLLGHAGAVVSLIMLTAVPAAMWGAWRFLRVVSRLVDPRGTSRWVLAWGAATYALVPVTSGAWSEGRIGTVVTAVLLPWLAHAALGFADPEADRRWRAAWRTGLLLALVASFAPVTWPFAALLCLAVLATAFALAPRAMRDRSVWGPPVVALLVVLVLLLPWLVPLFTTGSSAGLLLETGRLPVADIDGTRLLVGAAADQSAPWVLGALVGALATAALLARQARVAVVVCWLVALVAAVGALLLSRLRLDLATSDTGPSLGLFVVLLQGAAVVAISLAGQDLVRAVQGARERRVASGVLRASGVVAALVALVVPLGGLGWFLVSSPDSLDESPEADIPVYMRQSALEGPERGVLVVRGSIEEGLTYRVLRQDGATLGEDEILALTDEDTDFTATVRALSSRPTAEVVGELADRGIQYVVLPSPADGRVAATLDASDGLTQASAENRSTRAWQVAQEPPPDAVSGPDSWLRSVLLVVQALAVLVVAVLCGPTRKDVP